MVKAELDGDYDFILEVLNKQSDRLAAENKKGKRNYDCCGR